jgi:glycogen operon protein
LSWFDWSFEEKNREIYGFARGMNAFRRAHPVLRREAFYTDADIKWFAPSGAAPGWADPAQKSFACLFLGRPDADIFLMFNAGPEPVDFAIPAAHANAMWCLAVDTSRPAPADLYEAGDGPSIDDQVSFCVHPRSSAILVAQR